MESEALGKDGGGEEEGGGKAQEERKTRKGELGMALFPVG